MGLTVYNSSKSEGSMMYDDAFFQCIFLHFLANITRMTTPPPPRWGISPRWTRLLSKFGGVEPGWLRRRRLVGALAQGGHAFSQNLEASSRAGYDAAASLEHLPKVDTPSLKIWRRRAGLAAPLAKRKWRVHLGETPIRS
jgi:hypothetical protein